ncbi:MAG: cell division protein ZipA C-terminal FtsZ-binding domain-containing protein [Pseudomonadota bacterium]
MSDLQIAMIVLGVALVAAVWFYNRWVEKKHRQRAEQMLPRTTDDVLKAPEAEKTEPGIAPFVDDEPAIRTVPESRSFQPSPHPDAVPPEPSFMDADLPLEPEMASVANATEVDLLLDIEEQTADAVSIPVPDEWGDGRADCLLRMEFVAPVPLPVLWEEHRDWSSRIDKPIQWLGLDEKSGHWRTLFPQDSGSVKHLAVALQLVDRLGAVSKESLQIFINGASRLAQRFVGRVETPPLETLLERAQELDAFCASVDLQLSVHVLPQNTAHMSGALLKPLLDHSGLKLEGERFVATDETGAEAFALICRSATSFPAERVEAMELIDLIFSLDVPRVATGAQTFDRTITFARQCAMTLGGQLADAHRKPLPDATIATIRGRIEELQNRMADRGIAAGGVRALRLFA